MNPDNNNPTAPGADAPDTGLSMADGLSSAQDNLTSAGLAATDGSSSIMGLDAIGASVPEAVMAPPVEEPLIPAAPVPGSIGSVTSVPPLDADPSAAVPPVPPADLAGGAPADPVAPVADTTAEQPAAAPYNPFMQSSTAESQPAPAAPVAEPAAMPVAAPKSKPNLVTIIALAMDVVLLIATIVFAVLFVKANNKKPETVYVPSGTGTTVVEQETLTCERETDFAKYIDFANSAPGMQTLTANYDDDELSSLTIGYEMHFADEATADTALASFNAEQNELLAAIENSFGVDSSIKDGDLNISIVSGSDTLTDANAALLMYGLGNEQASVSASAVRALYESAGYTCKLAK